MTIMSPQLKTKNENQKKGACFSFNFLKNTFDALKVLEAASTLEIGRAEEFSQKWLLR